MIKKFGVAAVTAAILVAPLFAQADVLNRQLQVGMSGTDISAMQTFLAQDSTIYPQGIVSGYFGFLTKAAVSNFQSRNGIDPVGRVGPVTLPVLNFQMASGMNNNTTAAVITSVVVSAGRTTAGISWNTNEAAKGLVYYSSSPLMTTEQYNRVDVAGAFSAMTDTSLHTSQSISLANLQPNTTYYYMVYTTDLEGNVSVSWPSTFYTSN